MARASGLLRLRASRIQPVRMTIPGRKAGLSALAPTVAAEHGDGEEHVAEVEMSGFLDQAEAQIASRRCLARKENMIQRHRVPHAVGLDELHREQQQRQP